MSRWCLEFQGEYRDDRRGLGYPVYSGEEPLMPLYPDDSELGKLWEWVRLVIVDSFQHEVWLGRNPHVDIYCDLEKLLRARSRCESTRVHHREERLAGDTPANPLSWR